MNNETSYTVDCEYTDLFCGQANYSWVLRESIQIPHGTSSHKESRLIKAALGLTGVKCKATHNGDSWEFRPIGLLTVAFGNVRY